MNDWKCNHGFMLNVAQPSMVCPFHCRAPNAVVAVVAPKDGSNETHVQVAGHPDVHLADGDVVEVRIRRRDGLLVTSYVYTPAQHRCPKCGNSMLVNLDNYCVTCRTPSAG